MEKCVCRVRGKFHHCLQGQSHSKTEQPPRSWGGPDWNQDPTGTILELMLGPNYQLSSLIIR